MKSTTRSFYQEAVQGAIERIAADMDEALDLEELAAGACLSPFHFHRVFRGMVGETPLEMMRRLRLERAAWRLAATTRPVTEVAFEAGYETHEAFTRAFRACYSMSPSAFRRRRRLYIEIAASCGVHFSEAGHVPAFIPRDSGGFAMDVAIKEMPELRVGTVRHVGPYNQIPQAFERLGAIAQSAGLTPESCGAMLAIYHDNPEAVPPDQLRSDAAVVLERDVPMPAGLVEQRIAGGRYASAVHVGPYEQLGDAWARFMGEWLPGSGHRLGEGASYEIYLNDPCSVPKQELRTEMFIPIA